MYIQRILKNTKNIGHNIIYLLIICFSLILLNSIIFNNKIIEANTNEKKLKKAEANTNEKNPKKAEAKKTETKKAEAKKAEAKKSAEAFEKTNKISAYKRNAKSKNLIKLHKHNINNFSNNYSIRRKYKNLIIYIYCNF